MSSTTRVPLFLLPVGVISCSWLYMEPLALTCGRGREGTVGVMVVDKSCLA